MGLLSSKPQSVRAPALLLSRIGLLLAFLAGWAMGCDRPTVGAKPQAAEGVADGGRSDDHRVDAKIRLAAHKIAESDSSEPLSSATVPAWAADAVFYQIFPERFCNGDKSNDPTRESLESPDSVPQTWTDFALDRRLVRPGRLGEAARPELFRERRVQPPLRRRSAGRAR